LALIFAASIILGPILSDLISSSFSLSSVSAVDLRHAGDFAFSLSFDAIDDQAAELGRYGFRVIHFYSFDPNGCL
jgi:hypothetical protein